MPLEFNSWIRRVMAKFRSFKVGKRRPLNGSFNFKAGTHVWRIRGQHFPHVGVQKSGPHNVLIFTYDLWSCFVTWPEVSVISLFYVQYTHMFALHYNKSYTGVFGRLQRTRYFFFNAHWVGFVPLCALLLKWTSYSEKCELLGK